MEYWESTTPKQHMVNFIKQSKVLWPSLLKEIQRLINANEHIIFEGVSILPKLARRDLKIDGIYLLTTDINTVFTRLLAHTRWGQSEEMKKIEAKVFHEYETPYYRKSAKENGYSVFIDYDEAYDYLRKVFIK